MKNKLQPIAQKMESIVSMIIEVLKQVIFYLFALCAIFSAVNVVTTRNPVKGVLSLVLTFVAMAGIWILLHAEFLALILVVVYVGAVMTLFLFVVMMLNLETTNLKRGIVRYFPIALVIVLLIMVMIFLVVSPQQFGLSSVPAPGPVSAHYSNVRALGQTLYTGFVYPFEIAGALLLIAMVSAITLTFRGRKHRRKVNINDQLKTTKAERLRMVKNMKSGKE
jgi:NADH-quinone oxidoreductase subunit J